MKHLFVAIVLAAGIAGFAGCHGAPKTEPLASNPCEIRS